MVAACASADVADVTSSTRSGARLPSFNAGMTQLAEVVEQLGYEDLGGDHEAEESSSFLVGREGVEEFQITTGWGLTEPQGEHQLEPGPVGDFLTLLRRGDRAGVFFVCGDSYVEVLALDGDPEAGAAFGSEVHSQLCE